MIRQRVEDDVVGAADVVSEARKERMGETTRRNILHLISESDQDLPSEKVKPFCVQQKIHAAVEEIRACTRDVRCGCVSKCNDEINFTTVRDSTDGKAGISK